MKTHGIFLNCLTVLMVIIAFTQAPAHAAIGVEMILNNGGFVSFDHFKAELYLNNHDAAVPDAWIFGILEIAGEYYYWPDFGTDVNYGVKTIATGESGMTFLEFDFPDIDDLIPFGPMNFWGAWYMDIDHYGYDVKEFWLDEEHKWTPTPTETPESSTSTPTFTPVPPTCTPTSGPVTPTSTPPPAPTGFVYIPPGTFTMGSPSDEMCRFSDETQHQVTLTHGFYLQQTEVMQQQWVDVFGNNPSYNPGMSHPVEEVTWYDACIYSNRLSIAGGLTPCYYSDGSFSTVFDGTPPVTSGTVYWNQSANGYRLPTESEWEYACRAGTTTAYNSGQENTSCSEDPNLDPLAWYYYNSDTGNGRETHDVGLKQPNNWELYDMHGNVYEWCWDRYVSYPTVSTSGSYRLLCGGSWGESARSCRSAARDDGTPANRNRYLGFRLLRVAP